MKTVEEGEAEGGENTPGLVPVKASSKIVCAQIYLLAMSDSTHFYRGVRQCGSVPANH